MIFGLGFPRTRHCNSIDKFVKPTRYVSGNGLKRGGTIQYFQHNKKWKKNGILSHKVQLNLLMQFSFQQYSVLCNHILLHHFHQRSRFEDID